MQTRDGLKAEFLVKIKTRNPCYSHLFLITDKRGFNYTVNRGKNGETAPVGAYSGDILNTPVEKKKVKLWLNVYGSSAYGYYTKEESDSARSPECLTTQEVMIKY